MASSEQLREVPCRHIHCPALAAVAVLADQNQFGYALVGGAVRDAFHARQSNDHDIAVWGCSIADLAEIDHELSERGYVQSAYHNETDYDGNRDADCADGRYIAIIEYEHDTLPDVDVLAFSSAYNSVQDVLDSFDFNLNQFACQYDNIATSEVQTVVYGGDIMYQLRQLHSSHVTPERHERMVAKALDYCWIVPEPDPTPQLPLPEIPCQIPHPAQ